MSTQRHAWISRDFSFSAGHTLALHEGKCRHLHGHNYELTLTLPGVINEASGMVVDFSELKQAVHKIIDRFDHKFMIWDKDPRVDALEILDPASMVVLPFHPTAENLALYIRDEFVRLYEQWSWTLPSIVLHETRDCSASC